MGIHENYDDDAIKLGRLRANDPKLKSLVFSVTDKNAREFACALKDNTQVSKLFLGCETETSTSIMEFVADALEFNRKINFLVFKSSITKAHLQILMRGLAGNTFISEIQFQRYDHDDEEAQYIAEMLKKNKTLRGLNLKGKNIQEQGITAIANALKINKELTHLVLYGNRINMTGAKSLAEALKVNKKISYLDLEYCALNSKSIKMIADALKMKSNLLTLNLSHNGIDDEGAQAIAGLLCINPRLRHLQLSANSITAVGLRLIKEALCFNNRLLSVCISSASHTDAEIEVVADLIRHNVSLSALHYECATFTDYGAVLIANALQINKSLLEINLSRGDMSIEGVKVIAETIEKNSTVCRLSISSPQKWTFQELDYFRHAVEKNTKLTRVEGLLPANGIFKPWTTNKIKDLAKRNELNRTKCIAFLIRAYANPTENQAMLNIIGKDILMKILRMAFPELKPKSFQKLRQSSFFVPAQVRNVGSSEASQPSCSLM